MARRTLVVLVTALVALSVVATGIGTVSAQDGTTDVDGDLPPADDIYVEGNGDAVLVYENETDGNLKRANYGLDIGEGLFHALVVTDLDGARDARGNATAILTGESFTGNGNLSIPRPESVSNLSVNVTGMQTSENARFDATAAATIDGGNATSRLPVESIRTAGNLTVTASRFDAAVEAHAELSRPLGPSQYQEFHIIEQDGTYTLSASQEYTLSPFATQQWSTRQRAKQTLRQQYVSAAEALGGSADLTLESYSFTQQGGSPRLDIEYTVTYRGIERVLTNQLVTRLTSSQEVNLNQSEADAIATRLKNLTIEEVSVRYDQRAQSIDAAMRVDLRNYTDVVFAALDTMESIDMEALNASAGLQSNVSASLEQFRKVVEARQASNLTNQYTFAASLSKQSRGRLSFEGELHSRTKNWKQYVQELNDRGIQTSDVNYELHVATVGERIDTTVAVEVSGENLLRRTTDQLLGSTGGSSDTRKYVEAFRESGFQKARMDLSVRDGQLRVEAGAAFENLTALRDALATTEEGRTLQSVVGRTENTTVRSYVRVTDAVPANATEEDIRELAYVNDETTIHLPDSWDRTFPTMNTTRAEEYLGLSGSVSGLTGPGFGVVVALVALLAAAFIVGRRRQ